MVRKKIQGSAIIFAFTTHCKTPHSIIQPNASCLTRVRCLFLLVQESDSLPLSFTQRSPWSFIHPLPCPHTVEATYFCTDQRQLIKPVSYPLTYGGYVQWAADVLRTGMQIPSAVGIQAQIHPSTTTHPHT